jgi:hypothetical protein
LVIHAGERLILVASAGCAAATIPVEPGCPISRAEFIGANWRPVQRGLERTRKFGTRGYRRERKDCLGALVPAYLRCPIIPELRAIFFKTSALGDALRPLLAPPANAQAAFVYGSAATEDFDAHSDIDLMVIGDIPLLDLAARVAKLEKELERSIN